MGLLDEDRVQNPAKHFINVKNGSLVFYDKETGSNVTVPTPFEFIVLDTLATVKGWSASQDTGMWSNEVKSVGNDVLNVRTKTGIIASGLWKDIKDEVKADGGNFHSVIYLAAKGREGLETYAMLLKGAALSAWMEFSAKTNLKTNKAILSEWKEAKKGSVKYSIPVFTSAKISSTELEDAKGLARELKEYHQAYFSYNTDAHNEVKTKDEIVVDIDEGTPVDLENIPF